MANNTSRKESMTRYEQRCKVCNSYFKNTIEEMYDKGLTAKQIFEALHLTQDPSELETLKKEFLTEQIINRHLTKHYNPRMTASIKSVTNKTKLQQARENFKNGRQSKIDTVMTISHLIEVALIKLESLDEFPDGRQAHQLTINYMSIIKNLIDEFSKLTGELKIENTIDINFWNVQITEFANIVINTIRKMDVKFNLNSQLEYSFGQEFQKQWKEYKDIQNQILNGQLPVNYGERERNINTFNIVPDYKEKSQENNIESVNASTNSNEALYELSEEAERNRENQELEYIQKMTDSYNKSKNQSDEKSIDKETDEYYSSYHSDEDNNEIIINNSITSEEEYNSQVIDNSLQSTNINTDNFNLENAEKELNTLNKQINNLTSEKSKTKSIKDSIKKLMQKK